MTRDLEILAVLTQLAAMPAMMGAQPAVIPPEAHWTPDPLAQEAVETTPSTALLITPGVVTAAKQARQA
jgi:hypothetical protein